VTYTHKITGEKLILKKKYNDVGTFYIEKPYTIFTNLLVDTVICQFSNLELDEQKEEDKSQLTIFDLGA
jgi:hypothetical protein